MPATRSGETGLVVAAQAGDRRALDELIASCLPLVETITRRALTGDPDADDVVQEAMFRAVRDLPALRTPESLRPWLAAITVRQVSTHLQRRRSSAQHRAALDDVDLPDADADFADSSLLRLEVSGQRRQVERASRWLDADDRTLASLWWLETAGQLTRTELARAAGVSVSHAGVRVLRMRGQLELARSVVAALEARPRCAGLQTAVNGWDGRPSPVWRKRLARHTRSCPLCRRATDGLAPTERLLHSSALLVVPAGLGPALAVESALTGSAVSGATAAGVKGGILGQLVQAIAAHPVVAALTAGTVAATAATVASLPAAGPPAVTAVRPVTSPAAPPPPTTPRPTSGRPGNVSRSPDSPRSAAAGAGELTLGPAAIESVGRPGSFVTTVDGLGVLAPVRATADLPARQGATFLVVGGLANAACFSFRTRDGRFLRHSSWRLRLSNDEGTRLFRGDATFCPRAGALPGSIQLRSSNYPSYALRHRGDELWVDLADDTPEFRVGSSFRVRPALAG